MALLFVSVWMLSRHLMTNILVVKWLKNGDLFARGVTHIQDNTPESILISSFHSWPQPLGHSISFLLKPFLLPLDQNPFPQLYLWFPGPLLHHSLTDNSQCPHSSFGRKKTFIACIHVPSAPLRSAQGMDGLWTQSSSLNWWWLEMGWKGKKGEASNVIKR